MCLTEFDEEEAKRIWHQDGYTDGERNKALEVAANALSMNIPAEQVSKITGLSLEEVLELKKKIPVEA